MLNWSCSSVMAACMGVTYIIDHFLIIETSGSSDHGVLEKSQLFIPGSGLAKKLYLKWSDQQTTFKEPF